MILAAILDSVEKAKKKKSRQIPQGQYAKLGNNPSRGFRVRAETKCGDGGRNQQKQSVSTTTNM